MSVYIGMISDTFTHCINWLHAFWESFGAKPYFFMAFGMIIAVAAIFKPVLAGRGVGSDKARVKKKGES